MSENSVIAIKRPMVGPSLYELGLTVVHPFFGEKKRFEMLFNNWTMYDPKIKDKLNIIVVDDHGTPPIHELMTPAYKKHCDLNLDIMRINKNLKYNTPGALNLGIISAKTEYILIMDSDCTFSPEEMHNVMELRPDPKWNYKFPRKRVTNDAHWKLNDRYLPCTMLFNKDLFLKVNGFDEDFTGEYSKGYAYFDNHFDRKVTKYGYHFGVVNWISATEYMDDVVGDRVVRTRNDEVINKKLMYDKMNGVVEESKLMLRFPWELMFHNRRA